MRLITVQTKRTDAISRVARRKGRDVRKGRRKSLNEKRNLTKKCIYSFHSKFKLWYVTKNYFNETLHKNKCKKLQEIHSLFCLKREIILQSVPNVPYVEQNKKRILYDYLKLLLKTVQMKYLYIHFHQWRLILISV